MLHEAAAAEIMEWNSNNNNCNNSNSNKNDNSNKNNNGSSSKNNNSNENSGSRNDNSSSKNNTSNNNDNSGRIEATGNEFVRKKVSVAETAAQIFFRDLEGNRTHFFRVFFKEVPT